MFFKIWIIQYFIFRANFFKKYNSNLRSNVIQYWREGFLFQAASGFLWLGRDHTRYGLMWRSTELTRDSSFAASLLFCQCLALSLCPPLWLSFPTESSYPSTRLIKIVTRNCSGLFLTTPDYKWQEDYEAISQCTRLLRTAWKKYFHVGGVYSAETRICTGLSMEFKSSYSLVTSA